MQTDAEAVRSASLFSVAPPHETTFAHDAEHPKWAIQQMFNDCAAAFPDLEMRFYDSIRELNASPVKLELWKSATSEYQVMEMDGHLFLDWIVIVKLYQPAFPPFGTASLPLLIDQASRSNVAAGDSRAASDLAASEKLDGFRRFAAQRAICAAWDLPALAPAAAETISSEIPALVLAGSYDPVTPPAWSKATVDQLPNSTYAEFPGQGHDVATNNPCAESLLVEFLKDPWAELDLSCAEEEPGPSFTMPEDVFIAPGLAGPAGRLADPGPGCIYRLGLAGLALDAKPASCDLAAGIVFANFCDVGPAVGAVHDAHIVRPRKG